MNVYNIGGRLGADPEVKELGDGKLVCNMRVATKAGKDKTDWHRVVCYDTQAKFAAEYLKKGDMLIVEGRCVTREWTDKDGATRYTTECVAHRIEGCGSKGGGEAPEERPF